MIDFDYIIDKEKFGGQKYFKIKEDDTSTKILNHLKFKIKMRLWDKKVYNLLDDTKFLEGTESIPCVLHIKDVFKMEPAPERLQGRWIHQSLLIPFVSMCGSKGLEYICSKMHTFFESYYKVLAENEILKTNSTKTLFAAKEIVTDTKRISIENKTYTMKVLNHLLKKSGVCVHVNNTKKYKKKFMFRDIILEYLLEEKFIEQKDTHFYTIVNPVKGMEVYRPQNQGNKVYNKSMTAVQYIRFKPYFLTTLLDQLHEAEKIEKIIITNE